MHYNYTVYCSNVVETTKVETETDNFFETKTEIETGKFRDLRLETRNNRDENKYGDEINAISTSIGLKCGRLEVISF